MRLVRVSALAAAALIGLSGCSSSKPKFDSSGSASTVRGESSVRVAPPPGSTSKRSTKAPPPPLPSSSKPTTIAERVLAGMGLTERVGQLIMIDCPSTGVSDATRAAVTQDHVGSVILDGTNTSGVQAIQSVTSNLRGLAPRGVGLMIATDQEGGVVQRLQGPGFDRIPSGVDQGRLSPSTLQRNAQVWGNQLIQAGVNVNLSPVLDTVPVGGGPNPPIGDLDRQYGSTPQAVTSHGLAFARGMTAAGVLVTVKHFPGLGRVSGNTDTTGGVTDSVTTRDDPYLAPFRAAAKARVPFVMMSTAIYSRIDPGTPAAFSKTIVTGMLRGDLGFTGLIVSDDIGAAAQVSNYSVGDRAVRFIAAGGDVVLTVVADQAGPMTDALVARAKSDPSFRTLVDAAALRVLQTKSTEGLLT